MLRLLRTTETGDGVVEGSVAVRFRVVEVEGDGQRRCVAAIGSMVDEEEAGKMKRKAL